MGIGVSQVQASLNPLSILEDWPCPWGRRVFFFIQGYSLTRVTVFTLFSRMATLEGFEGCDSKIVQNATRAYGSSMAFFKVYGRMRHHHSFYVAYEKHTAHIQSLCSHPLTHGTPSMFKVVTLQHIEGIYCTILIHSHIHWRVKIKFKTRPHQCYSC